MWELPPPEQRALALTENWGQAASGCFMFERLSMEEALRVLWVHMTLRVLIPFRTLSSLFPTTLLAFRLLSLPLLCPSLFLHHLHP